ncbi:hypothetical protein GCM10027051_12760 [Niabella terrae]
MYKIILPLMLLLSGTINLQAQGWSIGDQVSFGHSWTVGNRVNEDLKYQFHPSFAIGRSAVYNFNPTVSLGLGTFFSTEGVSFKNEAGDEDSRFEQRMNYIRVPLFARFYFCDPASKVRGFIGAGGAIGFLVGGKTFTENEDGFFVGQKTRKALDNKVDAGATASLGMTVRIADGIRLQHSISYYHGLVEQDYENAFTDMVAAPFTNRRLSLDMGFQIDGDAMKRWKSHRHMGAKKH